MAQHFICKYSVKKGLLLNVISLFMIIVSAHAAGDNHSNSSNSTKSSSSSDQSFFIHADGASSSAQSSGTNPNTNSDQSLDSTRKAESNANLSSNSNLNSSSNSNSNKNSPAAAAGPTNPLVALRSSIASVTFKRNMGNVIDDLRKGASQEDERYLLQLKKLYGQRPVPKLTLESSKLFFANLDSSIELNDLSRGVITYQQKNWSFHKYSSYETRVQSLIKLFHSRPSFALIFFDIAFADSADVVPIAITNLDIIHNYLQRENGEHSFQSQRELQPGNQ